MKYYNIGIIMNGVTGRMGTNQHLLRSIAAIIKQGGVKIGEEETIMPDPILVGRNSGKLEKICELSGVKKMTTDLDEALAVHLMLMNRLIVRQQRSVHKVCCDWENFFKIKGMVKTGIVTGWLVFL